MKFEEINKYLNEMLSYLSTEDYDEYEMEKLNYYINNILAVKKALNSGKINPEKITEDILRDFINDELDLIRISDDELTQL